MIIAIISVRDITLSPLANSDPLLMEIFFLLLFMCRGHRMAIVLSAQ